jgi:mevalonate kinase
VTPRAALRTSAPAKLILGGEHAVVYGVPGLVVALPELRTEVTLRESSVSGFRVLLASIPQPSASQMAFVESACRTIVGGLGAPLPDATLEVRSSVPLGSGLGSSASLCVALARAFSRLHGAGTEPADIQRLANAAEQAAHGRASGLDTAAIAWGRPLRFVRGDAPQPLTIARELSLLVAHSGAVGSTQAVVMDLAMRREAEPERYGTLFDRVGTAVAAMESALAIGDLPALGTAMDANQDVLAELGVSHPQLDRLVVAAREAGAFGAKLTGAGWGGCAIALVTPGTVQDVGAALLAAGAAWVRAVTVPASPAG